MKFHRDRKFITGIAVPVSALVSKESCGCGEFFDLLALGQWCKESGFSVIQILPVQDTGLNPSPYSALHSMALNPVYLHLPAIEGSREYREIIAGFQSRHQNAARLSYHETYSFKVETLGKIFSDRYGMISREPEFLAWKKTNDWCQYYAAYKILCEINRGPVWGQWQDEPIYNKDIMLRQANLNFFLRQNEYRFNFFSYMQFELERQLSRVSRQLDKLGINLKGDLPVLMDKESSDVWYFREFFMLDYTAGAPPDDFSEKGQNWGFPVYDFEALEKSRFAWWNKRIQHLGRFFHALRLDHVIGYMRFWQIPAGNIHAGLGYFSPAWYLSEESLMETSFSEDEISNLSCPAMKLADLSSQALGLEALQLSEKDIDVLFEKYCLKKDNLIVFKNNFPDEKSIDQLNEPDAIKSILKKIFSQRSLIRVSEKKYAPAWYFETSGAFQNLAEEKKNIFRSLVQAYYQNSETVWYENGKKTLSILLNHSDCLICGEDLGSVPRTTAKLLEELGILSLKVWRWTRKYEQARAPFIALDSYPYLSVATTSVHDSENLRQWWQTDANGREQLFLLVKEKSEVSDTLDKDLAYELLLNFVRCSSFMVVFPIQDLLATEDIYRVKEPADERINRPGTIDDWNWSYRLPVFCEDILSNRGFKYNMQSLVFERQNWSPAKI